MPGHCTIPYDHIKTAHSFFPGRGHLHVATGMIKPDTGIRAPIRHSASGSLRQAGPQSGDPFVMMRNVRKKMNNSGPVQDVVVWNGGRTTLPADTVLFQVHQTPHRWIGVDLNTTGHVAVAAEPLSGSVIKLGRNMHTAPRQSSRRCTKLYREGKLWKLKKNKGRDRQMFKNTLNSISRQIVSFAESLCSGIKLEKLFSDRRCQVSRKQVPLEFSFENNSFITLQRLVEKLAYDRGIPVLYVNPAFTSKRCSRCGGSGWRKRKRFECRCCGSVIHADVNAAFNIALTSYLL